MCHLEKQVFNFFFECEFSKPSLTMLWILLESVVTDIFPSNFTSLGLSFSQFGKKLALSKTYLCTRVCGILLVFTSFMSSPVLIDVHRSWFVLVLAFV